MLKGINQWCYPTGTPIEKVFEYSRNAGFDAIELNLNAIGDVGLTMETTKQEAEVIAQLASQYDLQLRSLSTALLWQTPLSASDEAVRQKGINVIEKMLEIASIMGMDTILVVPGAVSSEVSYADCYSRSQEALKQILPTAEKLSVKIGVENVWNKFLLSPLEFSQYIDAFGSEYLGAYFDVGNVLQFGYPEQWIEILGSRIFKIHVKDFKTSTGNGTGFTTLLSGDVNWEAVKNALDIIGYKDTLTAELSPYEHCPHTLADDTARHIDVIIDS